MKKSLLLLMVVLFTRAIGFSNTVNDTITMGPGYANDVFYSLENGVVKTEPRNNWDIAFYTNPWSAGIIINDGNGVMLYTYPNGDTANWATLDTTGILGWKNLNNSDTIWEDGAFNRNALGHPDYGWGVYNTISHDVVGDSLYVVQLPSGAIKKVWIERKNSVNNTFFFKHANLDGTDEVSEVVEATPFVNKMFVYYNLTSAQIIDREPAIDTWDLLFSKYMGIVFDNEGNPSYYPVVGATNNINTSGSKHYPVTDDYEDWSSTLLEAYKTTIGHDWKSFSMSTFTWELADSTAYFLQTGKGDVYKLVFDYFGGTGNGRAGFVKKLVSLVGNQEIAGNEISMQLFPNPATNLVNILIANTKNNAVAQVKLFDLTGRMVIDKQMTLTNGMLQLQLNDQLEGLYLLQIETEGQAYVQKLQIK